MNVVIKYVGVSTAGVAVGFTAGWLVSKAVTTKKLRVLLEQELKDVEEYLERRHAEDKAKRNIEKPSPRELLEENRNEEELKLITDAYRTFDDTTPVEMRDLEGAAATMTAEQFREEYDRVPTDDELRAMGEPEPEKLRTVNAFDGGGVDEDEVGEEIEPPIVVRNPNVPYVIPVGDYMNPEEDFEGFDRYTVTFYEGDEVLTDDSDKTIPDIDGMVGLLNLHKFGKDSDNKDIVYVRNEKLAKEFEIMRVSGNYTEIVLGFAPKQSAKTLRMTREDD